MISLQRYQALFRAPDFASAMLYSVPGRLPMSISSFALLLFVQARTSSFALAGMVSALYVLGLAVLAPLLGRAIDRIGPKPVLSVCAAVYPLALIVLVVLVSESAPQQWIALSALISGASMPPITVCMRTLFPRLLKGEKFLQTAYALDSALIEVIFIFGPVLVSVFVAAGYTQGALWFAAVCGALGSLIFLRARAVKRWIIHHASEERSLLGPLHKRELLALFAATLLFAAAFGLFEVAVTAFATHRGSRAAAGVILGLASIGSSLGVLAYGSREWQAPLVKQLQLALVLMALGMVPVVPFDDLYWFAAIAVICCAPMSAVLAADSLMISRLAPHEMLAESFTWMATCLLAGISGGIAAGGVLVEHFSPVAAFLIAALVTGCSALVVKLGLAAEARA